MTSKKVTVKIFKPDPTSLDFIWGSCHGAKYMNSDEFTVIVNVDSFSEVVGIELLYFTAQLKKVEMASCSMQMKPGNHSMMTIDLTSPVSKIEHDNFSRNDCVGNWTAGGKILVNPEGNAIGFRAYEFENQTPLNQELCIDHLL